jgi:hypothetical protein
MKGLLDFDYKAYVSLLLNVLRLIKADVSKMLYMPTSTPHCTVSVATKSQIEICF